MRFAPLAAAAAFAALAACEERTVVADPEVMNDAADMAAETGQPTYTPIEVGNGADANAATGNDLQQGLDNTTVVAEEPPPPPQQ